MIAGVSPLGQTFLGTLFTWGVTALGAGLVFVLSGSHHDVLDASLGFAAGVMTAASFWSLLEPALQMAETSGGYGANGEFAFLPVAVGFLAGAMFVSGADVMMKRFGVDSSSLMLASLDDGEREHRSRRRMDSERGEDLIENSGMLSDGLRQRRTLGKGNGDGASAGLDSREEEDLSARWRRILLLIIAITVHNIPEGLAVGVGFAAAGKTAGATFEKARNLAVGIGIQNFPEGLAVSLPLRGAGMSSRQAFWYGQLSGMVEPAAGMLGAVAVSLAEPLLPYALSFAAGAMIYVVFDDIVPEAQTRGNGRLASWAAIVGFLIMMCLDVGLG
ncbi:zinc transporter ZIP11-like [Amphibalanus amphitrite]|uniref:zinc transporter ZIP11-like n=1 Tax=Amphibalanus amphitrite TaxID=1232801 RepID=UPI001C92269D|nr:zinc transporter ZIP11-like [Amphibalanus amphitrite]